MENFDDYVGGTGNAYRGSDNNFTTEDNIHYITILGGGITPIIFNYLPRTQEFLSQFKINQEGLVAKVHDSAVTGLIIPTVGLVLATAASFGIVGLYRHVKNKKRNNPSTIRKKDKPRSDGRFIP